MAVEGRSVVCRIKLFKDDLEGALARFQTQDAFHLQATALHEQIFLDYLNAHFLLELNGKRAEPLILSTGEDGAMWWAELQFTSTDLPQSLSLKNTLLFELFDDQKNIFQAITLPNERQFSYYFIRGDDHARFSLP
jgi:hypothetical protein